MVRQLYILSASSAPLDKIDAEGPATKVTHFKAKFCEKHLCLHPSAFDKCETTQCCWFCPPQKCMVHVYKDVEAQVNEPMAVQQVDKGANRKLSMGVLVTLWLVVCLGVGNRVLYKMSLVPLSNYVFFLAQLLTVGYVVVYCSILLVRYRLGIVTKDMLEFGRRQGVVFATIGLFETASQVLGLLGAARLPGVVLPLMQQTFMLWQLLFGAWLLGKKYSVVQIGGVAAVVVGVSVAATSAASASSSSTIAVQGIDHVAATLFLVSMMFPAVASIMKEKLFTDARKQLGGQELDIFVVNSFGSIAQAVCTVLVLPILVTLRGMTLSQLPDYLYQGYTCFRGLTPACGSDCSGAPLIPLAYAAANLTFNILALGLLRRLGSVTMSLAMSSVVPLTVWVFTLPLPLLPPSPPLGPKFLVGVGVLLAGMVLWNSGGWWPKRAPPEAAKKLA